MRWMWRPLVTRWWLKFSSDAQVMQVLLWRIWPVKGRAVLDSCLLRSVEKVVKVSQLASVISNFFVFSVYVNVKLLVRVKNNLQSTDSQLSVGYMSVACRLSVGWQVTHSWKRGTFFCNYRWSEHLQIKQMRGLTCQPTSLPGFVFFPPLFCFRSCKNRNTENKAARQRALYSVVGWYSNDSVGRKRPALPGHPLLWIGRTRS